MLQIELFTRPACEEKTALVDFDALDAPREASAGGVRSGSARDVERIART